MDRAQRLGITRVTDITRLDRLGIPVFASIRPNAALNSLCVNAGKGMTEQEARVGAYMESIEFAVAEYGASGLEVVQASARETLDGPQRPDAILDLCPAMGAHIPLDAPMACVLAEEIRTGVSCLVPAELVFLPLPRSLAPNRYFGENSNALSSGNTLLEATVHALTEIIERDILAFHAFRDDTVLVREETLPAEATELMAKIRKAGLQLYIRYRPNLFQMPWFTAMIAEPEAGTLLFMNGGYGCHPNRSIAILRAITEAVQARLGFIHGGRDDLAVTAHKFARYSREEHHALIRKTLESVSRTENAIAFEDIVDHSDRAFSLQAAYRFLVEALEAAELTRILRVVYTAPEDTLQVVRLLVPGAEFWTEGARRVGRRLREHVQRTL